MDVVCRSGNPLIDSNRSASELLTFGAVDVSWTPPLRNVAKDAKGNSPLAGALSEAL
jgi:hypothetical protein